MSRLSVLLLVWVLFPCSLRAQETQAPLVLPRLNGPIHLDGLSNEPAWQAVEPFPITMYQPVFEGTPTERTEIRIAYDDQYLYAAGRFYDADPSGIRINSLYRDRWSGDDAFDVMIDTYNNNESMLWFWTNPAGIRGDVAISDDGEATNSNWNTYWDAATVVNGEGWFAELRIPLSSLNFQAEDGRAVMGLTVSRLVARKNERVTFPSISPRSSIRKPSVAQDVVLENVRSQTPLYVTPYALAGVDQPAVLNGAGTAFEHRRDRTSELGLDLKYNLTNNLTLDLTANTDFAQVEADDQQINFTRFSLFFPEKRQFFQERAGLFDFVMSNGNRLFHSRRIGLDETGTPVRILGGARLVGRAGAWDVGLLDMHTARVADRPSDNFGVVRLRRQVFNPYSYAGGMVTSRIDEDGGYNLAYGLDGIARVAGDDYLTLKWSQTFDDQADAASLETGQVLATWQRRVNEGFAYRMDVAWSGAAYDPGIGFVRNTDFTYARGIFWYNRFLDTHPTLRSVQPSIVVIARTRNSDGRLESGFIGPWVEFTTKAGAYGWIEPRFYYEDVPVSFSISEDTEIPAGTYTYADLQLYYEMSDGRLLRTVADLQAGTFYDGTRGQLTLTPTWNASHRLELSGRYQLTWLRFAQRDQELTAHLGQLRVRFAMNARLSANTFLQYNSVARRISLNARFRYNIREGNDLWLVYDEGLNTERSRFDPIPPVSASRTLVVKYTHTFAL